VGERSPGTEQAYRDRLDNQVLPALGALRLRELSISRIDALLKRTDSGTGSRSRSSPAPCCPACSVWLPVTTHSEATSSATPPPSEVRERVRDALDLEQLQDPRAKLATDLKAQAQDLLDLIDLMVATGLRLGEALAVRWSALDLVAGT
jgi:integrase